MIYSQRAKLEVNESYITSLPQNDLLIFHMDEVDLRDNYKRGSFGMRI